VANPEQTDTDEDGQGDACEPPDPTGSGGGGGAGGTGGAGGMGGAGGEAATTTATSGGAASPDFQGGCDCRMGRGPMPREAWGMLLILAAVLRRRGRLQPRRAA
jgi:MYXO-CTERM domain-containing protein